MRPDFAVTEATVDSVKEALDRYGCCVLRQCVSLEVVRSIREVVQQCYADMDERFQNGTMSEEEHRHCYRYGIVRPFEEDLLTADGNLMRTVMLNIVQDTLLKPLLVQHFGTEVNLLIPSSHVRRVKPGSGVPYHQDSSVMKLHQTRILNCWFPLDPAGGDSPTMEVIPVGLKHLLEMGVNSEKGLYSHLQIAQQTVNESLTDVQTWTPMMFPGDVLLLDSYTVHRTHQTETMSRERCDFEMRFAARESIETREDIKQMQVDLHG